MIKLEESIILYMVLNGPNNHRFCEAVSDTKEMSGQFCYLLADSTDWDQLFRTEILRDFLVWTSLTEYHVQTLL